MERLINSMESITGHHRNGLLLKMPSRLIETQGMSGTVYAKDKTLRTCYKCNIKFEQHYLRDNKGKCPRCKTTIRMIE